MSGRARLASAVAAAARRLTAGAATPAASLPAAFEWAASSSAPGLAARTARFPWGKVSLGFAAAGLMTVADAPTAGCTAEATKVAAPSAARAGAAAAATAHKVVFVLGGPGSGKGTQCAKLVEEFGLTHLSAGDLLRAHMKSGSPEGQMVADMIKNGQIVPSRVTISLLQHAMDASGQHRFLIDGFPRNEENRGSFESQTGISPELVLFFDCPESVMESRLLGRNEGRTDDNIETIRKRFKVFLDSTLPIIQHYEARGKVARINADRPADEIYKEVRRLFLEM